MKKINVIALLTGIAMLFAAWLPLAQSSNTGLFVNISHVGGISVLIYALGPATLITAILGLYKPSKNAVWWYAGISGTGIVICGLSILMAIDHLRTFASMMGKGYASLQPGYGSIAMLVGVSLMGFMAYIASRITENQPAHNGVEKSSHIATGKDRE